MNLEVVEIDGEVDPEDIPLCPLCDQPIFAYERVAIGNGGEALALIHADCGEELEESE